MLRWKFINRLDEPPDSRPIRNPNSTPVCLRKTHAKPITICCPAVHILAVVLLNLNHDVRDGYGGHGVGDFHVVLGVELLDRVRQGRRIVDSPYQVVVPHIPAVHFLGDNLDLHIAAAVILLRRELEGLRKATVAELCRTVEVLHKEVVVHCIAESMTVVGDFESERRVDLVKADYNYFELHYWVDMLQEVVPQSNHLEECCRLENIHSYSLAILPDDHQTFLPNCP